MATPDTGVSSDVEVVENQPAVTSESGPDAAVASANEEFKHLGDTRLLCFDAPSVACAGVCCVGCGILSNALDTGTKLLPLGIPSLSAPCHFSVAGYSANALFSWLTLGVGALGACYCCVGSCVVLSLDGMICPKAVGEKVNDNVETKLAEMEVKVLGKTSQQVHKSAATKSTATEEGEKDPTSMELPAKTPSNSVLKKSSSKSSLEKKPSSSKMAANSPAGSEMSSPEKIDKFAAFKARKEQGKNSP